MLINSFAVVTLLTQKYKEKKKRNLSLAKQ